MVLYLWVWAAGRVNSVMKIAVFICIVTLTIMNITAFSGFVYLIINVFLLLRYLPGSLLKEYFFILGFCHFQKQ